MRIPTTTHLTSLSNTISSNNQCKVMVKLRNVKCVSPNCQMSNVSPTTPSSNTISSTISSNNQRKVAVKLKNVKCIFIVKNKSITFLNKFSKHKKNLILRYTKKVCLTIYPNNLIKIHATGISNSFDFEGCFDLK